MDSGLYDFLRGLSDSYKTRGKIREEDKVRVTK